MSGTTHGLKSVSVEDLKPFQKQQAVELPNTGNQNETSIYRNARAPELVGNYPTIKTMYEGFQASLKFNPSANCLGFRPALELKKDGTIRWGGYVWQTYRQISERRINFGCGLVKLFRENVSKEIDDKGKWRLGLYSVNRPEWTIAEIATHAFSLVSVPLYETLGPDSVEFIINHAELSVIVCSIDKVADLLRMQSKIPTLKMIISMDPLNEGGMTVAGKHSTTPGHVLRQWALDRGIALFDFKEVESVGLRNRIPLRPPQPEDISTVCYTSGTTGNPKGVLLTHANVIASVRGAVNLALDPKPNDVFMSYLPLAHVYERSIFSNCLINGVAIGYSRGDVTLLLDDIATLRPTIFISVPRLLNRIYDRIVAQTLNGPSQFRASLFRTALEAKTAHLKATGSFNHMFWDRLVFNKVRALLGGRVRFIMSGSAPISPEVLTFLRVCFCCEVVEGYGQTESTASISTSWMSDFDPGSVGPVYPSNEMKLVSIPEMGYTVHDKPYPRGEVLVRGYNIFKGYLKDEAKTREVLSDDGWLKTGDVGLIDGKGRLQLIDRKKNIFKLAQGEYVAPEKSELVGVVVPDFEVCIADAKNRGWISSSTPDPTPGAVPDAAIRLEIIKHPEFYKLVAKDLDRLAKENKLQGFEMIKAFKFEIELCSIENGLLTPTFKIKRFEAVEKFKTQIEEMYAELSKRSNMKGLNAKL
ncbi:Long chain acyl-CoA synthetase 7 peroxisomal [Nowakowskiella sp. JEL0407]|nr:Long chain acyl-CoA synthetase 7 peroxisomal [Nowakowskiella sp. JEL0407]